MIYDNLQIKAYDIQLVQNGEKNAYILSFDKRKHIKVSEKAKMIIECFDGKKTATEIIYELENKGIPLSSEDFYEIVDEILISNDLLVGVENKKELPTQSYMWCHFPIIETDKLSFLFKILRNLYCKYAVIIVLLSILVCSIFDFVSLFNQNTVSSSSTNSLFVIIIVYVSLIFHEFGHISAAYRYNISVGKIGIGMYLFSPVLYVDLTNIWRLNAKQRVLVDAGGVYFQLITLIPLTITYIFTNNRNYCLMCITILILAATNFIPFIKLDGYWILTDYFKLDNLSRNAFKVVNNFLFKREAGCNRSYRLASLIYVFSTVIVMIIGVCSAVGVLYQFDFIYSSLNKVFYSFISNHMKAGFVQLNNILLFIFPLIFLAIIVLKLIKNILKGLFKNLKERTS